MSRGRKEEGQGKGGGREEEEEEEEEEGLGSEKLITVAWEAASDWGREWRWAGEMMPGKAASDWPTDQGGMSPSALHLISLAGTPVWGFSLSV